MPITARFSKLFYDRLGDEVVNELVNWLNTVDAGYRGELRELNDINYARFDASVKQQFAERFAQLDQRLAERFAQSDQRFAQVEQRFAQIDQRLAELDAKIDVRFAESDAKLERGLKEHTRWMFLVWSSLLVPIVGLWMRG